ncbi:MAG: hypothetical protein QNJ67_09145 [Kiloniellales bacterium]|nr:hypothetical protein [Kiloniellales bacterium]
MIGRGGQSALMPMALVVVGLGIAWMLYQQLQSTVRRDFSGEAVGTDLVTLPQEIADPVYRMPPMRQFDAILQRPLFSQSRRPVAVAEAAPAVVSGNLGLALLGITIASDERFALVIPEGGGDTLRLREGQDYQGWMLSAIEPDTIVFTRAGAEERLELSYDVAPPPQQQQRRRRTAQPSQSGQNENSRRKRITGADQEEGAED